MLKKLKKLLLIKVRLVLFLAIVLVAPELENRFTRLRMENYAEAVVSFVHPQRTRIRYGTGFSIEYKEENYLVTNMHVCNAGKKYDKNALYFRDRTGRLHSAKKYHISRRHDLCIIKGIKLEYNLTLSENPLAQDKVFIIGHPLGNSLVIRQGYVNDILDDKFAWIGKHRVNFLFLNILSYPGNSGSPILNYYGDVVGILFAGLRGANSEAMAVPVSELKKELDSL